MKKMAGSYFPSHLGNHLETQSSRQDSICTFVAALHVSHYNRDEWVSEKDGRQLYIGIKVQGTW